jgi:DNA-binding transcriptional LysR family regulator
MKADINLLRVFVAVFDSRSVSRASIDLGISQPSASAALARLRKVVGDPLFVRSSHGVLPTPRAQESIGTAREVLDRVDRDFFRLQSFDPSSVEDEFTLCLSDAGEMVFLPKLIAAVRKQAPGARFRSLSLRPDDLKQCMESGEVSLAIGSFPDLKRHTHVQQRLFTHDFICLLGKHNPIKGKRMTLAQFVGAEHAVVHAEGRSREIFEQELARRGIHRRVVLHAAHFTSIPFIIERSNLIVTVPSPAGLAFSRMKNIRLMSPPLEVPRVDVKQYWHTRFHSDPRHQWLRSMVFQVFREEDVAPHKAVRPTQQQRMVHHLRS